MVYMNNIEKRKPEFLFNNIASNYDLINKVLSLNLEKYWRKKFIGFIPLKSDLQLLDIATGTGAILIEAVKKYPLIKKAYGIDISKEMVFRAQKKIFNLGLDKKIFIELQDARNTFFNDETFDCITISFGVRNMDTNLVLKEAYRLLKKSGKLLIMEFSMPYNKFIQKPYKYYLKILIPNIGGFLSQNFAAYNYLSESIISFSHEKFYNTLKKSGFSNIKKNYLFFGILSIYQAYKENLL